MSAKNQGRKNTGGVAGTKTGMIWEVMRLVRNTNADAKKRKAKGRKVTGGGYGFVDLILLENVKGLLYKQDVESGRGAGVVAILTALEAHGYSVAEEVVAAKAAGSTQQRDRVFILATRVGSGLPLAADLLLPRGRPCLGGCSAGEGPCWAHLEKTLAGLRAKVGAGCAASEMMGHSLCLNTSDRGQERTPRLDDIATLTERNGEGMLMLVPGRDNLTGFLTLEIAERIVGFPVGWTAVGPRDKTMRWSVLGNAVDVAVARMLAAQLHPAGHAAAHGAYERGEDTPVMVQALRGGETVMMGSGRSPTPFPQHSAVWSDADGEGFFMSPRRDKYPVHVRAVPLVQALASARRAGHHVRCAATTPENRVELSKAIKMYRSEANLNDVGKKLLDEVLASLGWYTP